MKGDDCNAILLMNCKELKNTGVRTVRIHIRNIIKLVSGEECEWNSGSRDGEIKTPKQCLM